VSGSPYAITCSGQSSTNYAITYAAGQLTVTAAPLSITANNASRQYGQADPTFTATYSGFVNSEDQSVLTGTLACTSPATPSSAVSGSPYAITCSGQTSTNYAISFVAGQLSVTKATPAFGNLTASQTIGLGTASVTLSGKIAAGTATPSAGETVTITINGASRSASTDSTGSFTASFDTHAIPAAVSAYVITYSYAGDSNFNPATNTSTTLTVINTPVGTNVTVSPVDVVTGTTPITLVFSNVTQTGVTTLTTGNPCPASPSGFAVGAPAICYDVATTALFSGTILVTINFAGVTFANAAPLALFHFEGGAWVDHTVSVDTVHSTITGMVNFLSPFAVLTQLVPTVSLSSTSLSFQHNINLLTCPPKTVTLANTGGAPLTITSITASGAFTQTNDCGTSVAPGASCTITVTFTPKAIATVAGAVTITDNAADSSQTVALAGTGLPPCVLLSSARSAHLVRGTDSTEFTISDPQPSCHSSTLSLACAEAGPVSCLFNPGTIPPSGSSLLRLANLSALATDALNFRVTGTSGPDTTAVDLTVWLTDFSVTPYPTTATVAAGQTASYALTLAPVNGLAGNVQWACQGAPAGASCAVSPSTTTLNGTSPVQVTVTATTTARSLGAPGGGFHLPPLGRQTGLLLLAGLLMLVMVWARSRRPVLASWGAGPAGRTGATLAVLGATLLLVLVWAACGGGGFVSNHGSSGTPAGSYALTVTGTYTDASGQANNLSHTTTLTLKVN
jgi:hypothetical protein